MASFYMILSGSTRGERRGGAGVSAEPQDNIDECVPVSLVWRTATPQRGHENVSFFQVGPVAHVGGVR